jgi:hypothetical protein
MHENPDDYEDEQYDNFHIKILTFSAHTDLLERLVQSMEGESLSNAEVVDETMLFFVSFFVIRFRDNF